jgi:hypothetical protein
VGRKQRYKSKQKEEGEGLTYEKSSSIEFQQIFYTSVSGMLNTNKINPNVCSVKM